MAFVELPVTPECEGLLIATGVIQGVVFVILGLRLSSRVLMKTRFGLDDLFIAFAAVMTTVMLALFGFCKLLFQAYFVGEGPRLGSLTFLSSK
jgi:hypothetical protein